MEISDYCREYKVAYLEVVSTVSFNCGSQKHTIAESEQIEKQFRHYIQQIDPTALSDENNMWSIYAEEIGYSI